MRGLELGGGAFPRQPTYEQYDLIDWGYRTGLRYTLGDARKLPYDDETFDSVFAANLLEHFGWRETTEVLKEWRRVLKVGGTLEIIVPDVLGQVQNYYRQVRNWDDTVELIAGSQEYPGNHHLCFFTVDTFKTVLDRAGAWDAGVAASHAGDGLTAVAIKLYG